MARYMSETSIGIFAVIVVIVSKILQAAAPTGWLFNCGKHITISFKNLIHLYVPDPECEFYC